MLHFSFCWFIASVCKWNTAYASPAPFLCVLNQKQTHKIKTMKKFINSLLIISAASFTLMACKKEAFPEKVEQPASEAPNATMRTGGAVIATPKIYTLTKRGNDTLIYNNDGRLAKVQHTATAYTQYNYGLNTITAKKFVNNSLANEVTYKLDVNTGRTIESNHIDYTYSRYNVQTTKTDWVYTYDATGRLVTKKNKAIPNQRFFFVYEAKTWTMYEYSIFNTLKYRTFIRFNQSQVLNKLKLNPEGAMLDLYLSIFGKQSQYLSTGVEFFNYSLNDYTFAELFGNYVANADGYATEFLRYNLMIDKPKEMVFFSYKIGS